MKLSDLEVFEQLSDSEQVEIVGGGSSENFMTLLDQSTAQTLAIQEALLRHNLTVGPAMAAKSASEDSKKV